MHDSHECPGHGEFEDEVDEKNIRIRVNCKPSSPKSPTLNGIDDRKNIDRIELSEPTPQDIIGKDDDGNVSGTFWAHLSEGDNVLSDQETCSETCFWLKSNRKLQPNKSELDEDWKVFEMLRPAYETDRRGPCMLAQSGLINKTCVQVSISCCVQFEATSLTANRFSLSS